MKQNNVHNSITDVIPGNCTRNKNQTIKQTDKHKGLNQRI